jgi:hypothetical protein
MAKLILNNWSKGQVNSEIKKEDGTYASSYGIDLYRNPGYLLPAYNFTGTNDITPSDLNQLIKDIVVYNDKVYLLGASDRIWGMSDVGTFYNNAAGFTSGGVGHGYYDFGSTVGESLAIYPIQGVNKLFYFIRNGSTAGDIGMYNLTDTFDDDWGSTIPANAGVLQSSSGYPNIVWNAKLWFGNGQYVGKLDGTVGANGTLTLQTLDLGLNWRVTSLFPSEGNIGICANRTDIYGCSAIFFWDGASVSYSYKIDLRCKKIMASGVNSGVILLIMQDELDKVSYSLLSGNSISMPKNIAIDISGTKQYLGKISNYRIDSFRGKFLCPLGEDVNNSVPSVISYINLDGTLSIPYLLSSASGSFSGTANQVSDGKIYASYSNGTDYKLVSISTGNCTANFKDGYTDFGQRVSLNYIKVYFKSLASGDSATLTLNTNYGTSNSIQMDGGVISYALDGAITSKKFDLGGITCHSVAPVINWTAGGMTISKIVLDYNFLED